MSDLLTVAQLREHVQTALGDEALQRIIDSNDGAITRFCGRLTIDDYAQPEPVTEVALLSDDISTIWLKRRPMEVQSVATVDTWDDTETELVVDTDYRVDGSTIYRMNALWGARTNIVYIPMNDSAERTALLIQLCQLQINVEPGMTFQGAATWQETYRNFETEKQSLIWAYCPPHPFA